jgi:hypothetical protein
MIKYDNITKAGATGCLSFEREGMRLRPDLALLPLDDEIVAFSEEAQCLVGLNAPAALVVQKLRDGLAPSAIERELVASGLASTADAGQWVTSVLRALHVHGMVAAGTEPFPPAGRPKEELDVEGPWAAEVAPYKPFNPKTEQRYRLVHTCVLIRYAFFAQKRLVDAVIGHLATEELAEPDVVLDIQGVMPDERHLYSDIYRDRAPVAHARQLSSLGPLVKAAVWQSAVNAYDYLLYIHAGVVGLGRNCILLPAPPGSGKSSLTVALTHRGLRYYSDEVALVDRTTFQIPPVPLATCVKSTGWDLMGRYFPNIEALPPHRREDGKLVRYIPPPPGAALHPPVPVSHIVFPRYEPSATTALESLARPEALTRLMGECLALKRRLDQENVRQILRWIEEIDCYDLPFSSLDEAAEQLIQAVDMTY